MTIGKNFERAISEYLSDCRRRNYSVRTVRDYRNQLTKFFEWLSTQQASLKDLSEISREMIAGYQMYLYKRPSRFKRRLAVGSQYHWMGIVVWFFRWLVQREKILTNPAASIHLPKRGSRLPRNYLSLREMQKLLSSCDLTTHLGLRNRAAIEVLYSTGIRAAELCAIKAADLNLQEGLLTVHGKGKKERVVPIGKAAVFYVNEYIEKSRLRLLRKKAHEVLLVTERGDPLTYDALNILVSRTAKAAGIKRRITPHALRHTCATLMLRGHADIRHIQELLGHSSLSSTQIYTKVEISDLKKAHARCHPREKQTIEKAG